MTEFQISKPLLEQVLPWKKSSNSAAGFINSVTNLEKASRNEADGKFSTEEFFSWSDSCLKALFTTPTTNRSSNVKHDQEDAVRFTFPDESRSCDDIEIRGSGDHDFDGQWESEPFDEKTQDPTATPSNEMYGGVSNFEES
ncbi:hypothetical protein L6452_09554 [Arctium lappa]|uniref:Uncharacterized protein n=1 Tax=Arctium lappa TaxID=4217 RepID=A0ACB9DL83_ARCLA|nr:hypothetical protein L6452_09554 [Arctium lappa]